MGYLKYPSHHFSAIWRLTLASLLASCQPAIKSDLRTPVMPVFANIQSDDYAKSNPYFTSVTAFFDHQTIKLTDGAVYSIASPSWVSPIGTYYEFPINLYVYAMTGGLGGQFDFFKWSGGKLSMGLILGLYENIGVQVSVAEQVKIWESVPIVSYISLQRRTSRTKLGCYPTRDDKCVEGSPGGGNKIQLKEDLFNPLIGLQFGRFLLKRNSRTTVYVKLEVGYNQILSRRLVREDFPSDYQHSDSPFVNLEMGFTLW